MDIQREGVARRKLIRRTVYLSLTFVGVALAGWRIDKLKPAAPAVERSTVWLDTVRRGEMLRDVRGLGTLVPVDVRWIPAQSSARVDKIILQSGAMVKPNSTIL